MRYLLTLLLFSTSLYSYSQILVEQGYSIEQYVNDILIGNGLTATNVSFSGSLGQMGYLSGGEGLFSVTSGLVLSTDNATNLSDAGCSNSQSCSGCLGVGTDLDLLNVANSVPPLIGQSFSVSSVNDLCILEFDFEAGGDSISFNYVFGSNEYLTFVNTQYNDIFAFFLSGPGISGTYASPAGFPDGAINIAQVPDSDPPLPITISSVNDVLNQEYYVDNPEHIGICINGYTVPFTASALVQCGENYHIKLAIADGSDSALKSFVVIEEINSFGMCACEEMPVGECDCDGNVLDECGVCGGSGIADGDCDCEGNILDECDVCDGPGAIYECGCYDIPEGDCDCYGNELDACGECGGESGCLFCDEGTYWNVDTQTCLVDDTYCSWQPDSNADGNIGIGDLLDLLSVFGDTDYDEDGVFDSVDDCVDPAACNYQSNPTEPCYYIDVLGVCGGGCEADEDGDAICDDIDDCIGVIDECGVCNGPGPTEVVIESITILYDSVYASDIDYWFVYETGADTVFNYFCEPVFTGCGDLVAHEGHNYSTVQIGDQCWFSENCRYLPEVSPSSEGSETSPYYYVYGYEGTDASAAMSTSNYATYGVLYNWPAVMTEGICPIGWHIPSDGEWMELEMYLGMSEAQANNMGARGTDEGYQMKSTSGWWYNDDNGSNSSGFSALPGGYQWTFAMGMNQVGVDGYWWTSSEADSNSFKRGLGDGLYNPNKVSRSLFSREGGFSARCVRD